MTIQSQIKQSEKIQNHPMQPPLKGDEALIGLHKVEKIFQ
jgi:hypothetical protein